MKRVLSFLMATALLLSVIPTGAVEFALTAKAATEEYYTYETTDGEATITDVNTAISGNVVIPSTLGGYPVTEIAGLSFYGCNKLTSITIPATVVRIGDYAFHECKFTSVTMSDNVMSIGEGAFKLCSSLKSIVIPASVTTISEQAFLGCSALTSVTIPNSVTNIKNYAFSDCNRLANVYYGGDETDRANMTIGGANTKLTSAKWHYTCQHRNTAANGYVAPTCTEDGYTGDTVCTDCGDVLGAGAVVLATGHAYGDDNICAVCGEDKNLSYYTYEVANGEATITEVDTAISGDVVIPETLGGYPVTSIGSQAFFWCTKLTSVVIPESVTSIGYAAFYFCTSLASVTIGDGVTNIEEFAFGCCNTLESITIPAGVTSIENGAFADCDSLTSIVVAEGNDAFCSEDGVLFDKNKAHLIQYPRGKSSTAYIIPNSVTVIVEKAFLHCAALTSVTIPAGVTSIGEDAFSDCSNLANVYYDGDETDRANMTIGGANTKLTSAKWHYTCQHRNTAVNGYVAPTCTEDGYTGDTVCANCGEMLAESTVIPATGHTEVIQGAVDATTSADGYTGDVVCDVCDVLLEEGTVIPAKVASIVNGRYYEDGVKVPYAGLVLYEGNYYYVGDHAKVVTGRFMASRFNAFEQFTAGYYYFDENGVMNTEEAVIDGCYYAEGGKAGAYAGLVEVKGHYYYVLSKGEAVVGRYEIVKDNGLKADGIYGFDTEGKMVFNTVMNGFYYSESGRTESFLGLVKAADGNMYYVTANGKVVRNEPNFFVSKTNGLVAKAGRYAFGFDGRMTTAVSTVAALKAQIARGGNLMLTEDLLLTDEPLTITQDTVLDLGGHTLAGRATLAAASNLITVAKGATLTLKNGTITFEAGVPDTDWGADSDKKYPGYANNTINCRGTLIVDGATILNTTAAGGASYAIDCYEGADLIVNSGLIDGGDKVAIRMFANSDKLATNVTINGGTVSGYRAVWIQLPGADQNKAMLANLTVNGGTLVSVDDVYNQVVYCYSYGNSFNGTTVTLNGGTYEGDVALGGGGKGGVKYGAETVTVDWENCIFNGAYGVYTYNPNATIQ